MTPHFPCVFLDFPLYLCLHSPVCQHGRGLRHYAPHPLQINSSPVRSRPGLSPTFCQIVLPTTLPAFLRELNSTQLHLLRPQSPPHTHIALAPLTPTTCAHLPFPFKITNPFKPASVSLFLLSNYKNVTHFSNCFRYILNKILIKTDLLHDPL